MWLAATPGQDRRVPHVLKYAACIHKPVEIIVVEGIIFD